MIISLSETEAALFKRGHACGPDDQVIKNVNIKQFTGFYNGAGNGNIIRAGGGVSAGMIVGNDDRGGIV